MNNGIKNEWENYSSAPSDKSNTFREEYNNREDVKAYHAHLGRYNQSDAEFVESLANSKFDDEYKNENDYNEDELNENEYLNEEQQYVSGETFESAPAETFQLPVASEVVLDEYPNQEQESVSDETLEMNRDNENQSLDGNQSLEKSLDGNESLDGNQSRVETEYLEYMEMLGESENAYKELNESENAYKELGPEEASKQKEKPFKPLNSREDLENHPAELASQFPQTSAKCFIKGLHKVFYNDNGFTFELYFQVDTSRDYVYKNNKNETVPVRVTSLVEVLTTRSTFKGLKIFPFRNIAYLYCFEVKAYVPKSLFDVKVLLFLLLREIFGPKLYNRQLLDEVYQELEFSSATCVGRPSFDKNFLSFCNGFLNLRTLEFRDEDYKKFVLGSRGYKYESAASNLPNLDTFLDAFCCSDENRKKMG